MAEAVEEVDHHASGEFAGAVEEVRGSLVDFDFPSELRQAIAQSVRLVENLDDVKLAAIVEPPAQSCGCALR